MFNYVIGDHLDNSYGFTLKFKTGNIKKNADCNFIIYRTFLFISMSCAVKKVQIRYLDTLYNTRQLLIYIK